MTAVGATQSVSDYLDRKPMQKPSDIIQRHELHGDIEFDNVSLIYPARSNEIAIQNMSFKIKSGQTFAFVGPSGSGKSTCIKLLERSYDPTRGKILIMVEQFTNMIINNNDETTMIQPADQVNTREFISELISDYNTKCAQRDSHLSDLDYFRLALFSISFWVIISGQKQCVSTARAIIRKPTVLLLDKTTSALDPVNNRLFQDALYYKKNSQEPRTVPISVHRLSTME
ncbi:unnamed protein product [Rotaria sp. Silwood2]|nr:unnamed protein product [Rotaria sp. Silwood2]